MWDNEILLNKFTRGIGWMLVALLLWAGLIVASRLPVFDLHKIQIKGAQQVTYKQARLAIAQSVKGNFFTVNLAQVRAAFIKLPWARDASIRRRWPDGLIVTLEEHQPLARWNDDALLNRYGEVFKAASDLSLPLLRGPDGSEQEVVRAWTSFSQILAPLKFHPVSVSLSDRRSWSLVLDSGVQIALGRDQASGRLSRWVNLYPQMVAQLSLPVEEVDLRYPQGFAVRLLEIKPKDRSHAIQAQGKTI